MTPLDLKPLLAAAIDAALEAGREILEVYAGEIAVDQKRDLSPVTLADGRAEAVILRRLAAATPDIPIISEEQAESEGLPAAAAERFWLVDPLDGTKEFIKRNGEFTVNIALIEHGRPILGVVGIPVQGLIYAAAGPGTAHRRNPDGTLVPIGARACPDCGATVTSSRSHATNDELRPAAGDPRGRRSQDCRQCLEILHGRRGRRRSLPADGPDDGMGHRGRSSSARSRRRPHDQARRHAVPLRQARFSQSRIPRRGTLSPPSRKSRSARSGNHPPSCRLDHRQQQEMTMADKIADDANSPERTARIRAVQDEACRLGEDVTTLGQSVREYVEVRTREQPIQTVAIALAIGWLIGRHA